MPNVDKYYKYISNAETGGEKNPNIRTKVNPKGGSTAFGPVQVTRNLAKGAYKEGYLGDDSKKFYNEVMSPMYDKMLYHGANKGKIKDYDSRYDYGGDSYFNPKKHGKSYEKYAKEIMKGILEKESKGDEKDFVRRWRGKTEKEDPEYYKRYSDSKFEDELGNEMLRQLGR